MRAVFGLLSVGFSTSMSAFLNRMPASVEPALRRAAARNLVRAERVGEARRVAAAMLESRARALASGQDGGVGAVLRVSGPSSAEIARVVQYLASHRGSEKELWARAADSGFDTWVIQRARRALELGDITLRWAPMVKVLLSRLGGAGVETLATLSPDDWVALTAPSSLSSVPPGLPVAGPGAQRPAYASLIRENLAILYPSAVATAELIRILPPTSPTAAFLAQYPSFDLATSNVFAFPAPPEQQTAVLATLRLYRVTPTADRAAGVVALQDAGWTSAAQILRAGRVAFTSRTADLLGAREYPLGTARVRITLTGSRVADEAAANAKAGFTKTPAGYAWHHDQDVGLMQLVDEDVHALSLTRAGSPSGRPSTTSPTSDGSTR